MHSSLVLENSLWFSFWLRPAVREEWKRKCMTAAVVVDTNDKKTVLIEVKIL